MAAPGSKAGLDTSMAISKKYHKGGAGSKRDTLETFQCPRCQLGYSQGASEPLGKVEERLSRSRIVKSALILTLLVGGCAGPGGTNRPSSTSEPGSTNTSGGSELTSESRSVSGFTAILGSGNVVSESRNVSGFTEVALQGIGNLSIQQTGSESLTIEAEDNIIPKLRTEVNNGRLTIGIEPNTSIQTTKPINYKLTVKDLNALELSGAGRVDAENINTNNLKITNAGSGDVAASISANNLNVAQRGSGDVKTSGKADSQDVNISGSGSYQAENLQSKEAKIVVNGSGEATVNVSDKLDVRINGSGSVEYSGNPNITQRIRGSGDLVRR
jgi:carbon monoxide dehydrogenase subunit G